MSGTPELLGAATQNNLMDEFYELRSQLKDFEAAGNFVESLAEVANSVGEFQSYNLWAGTGDPNDPTTNPTGVGIFSPGMPSGDDHYPLFGLKNGVLQWYGDVVNGVFYAGAGAVILDEDGVTISTGEDIESSDIKAYKFRGGALGGMIYGGLYGHHPNLELKTDRNGDSSVVLKAQNLTAGKVASILARINSGAKEIILSADTIELTGALTNNGNPIGAAEYPKRLTVFADELITTPTVAITLNTSQQYAFYVVPTTANANDGDEYSFSGVFESGAYNFTILGLLQASSGIVDFYIDGALSYSGQDWYSAAVAYNTRKYIYDRVLTAGYHYFTLKINGKNASSSDYTLFLTKIEVKQDSDSTGYGGSRALTLPATAHCTMQSGSPTTVNTGVLYIGEHNAAVTTYRALIQFADLANGYIPAGATLTDVKLRIAPSSDLSTNATTLKVYRVKQSGTVFSQACWNNYATGSAWESAGCDGTTNDREATEIGSLAIANNLTLNTYIEVSLDTVAVSEMLKDGGYSPNILLLRFVDENNDAYAFNIIGSSYPPQLVVTYSVTEP